MNRTINTTTCRNCGNVFQLNFCNRCGQPARTGRITWKALWRDWLHAIFHVDAGFFYTLKGLCEKPGYTIRDYLDGKRSKHFNPLLLVILLAGILSYLYVHFHLRTLIASVSLDSWNGNELVTHKYFFIRVLFFCIICSIGDFVLAGKKFTLPEIVTANFFMLSGVTVIQLLLTPALLFFGYQQWAFVLQLVLLAITGIYLFIARVQLFDATGKTASMLKIAIAVCLYFVVIFVVGKLVVKPWLTS